jgi:glutathionylspermidine synthase
MHRIRCEPREGWARKVSEIGLTFHSHEHGPYWDESVEYRLTHREVETLERAAEACHRMALEAAESVIKQGCWDRLRIPEAAIPSVVASWEHDDFSLYGRFDFAFDGTGPAKLLEYNADTPTALIEASIAQWFWLQDRHPGADQFNSLHERLIEAWRRWAGTAVHFSSVADHPEDEQTILYLRDTAEQAGVLTRPIHIGDIGWDTLRGRFVDLEDREILTCFKLYPWEWIWREEFAQHLANPTPPVQFIEPTWKMLLANKGLLPILWELFPDHPNLLPAYESSEKLGPEFVRKTRLGREGRNVTWIRDGTILEEDDLDMDEAGHVYQAPARLAFNDGQYAVLGVWMIDHTPAGLGIREDSRRITGNLSRFVPHYFV